MKCFTIVLRKDGHILNIDTQTPDTDRWEVPCVHPCDLEKGLGVHKNGVFETYYMRHSWATIARNDCRVSKDDINLVLNHVDADV